MRDTQFWIIIQLCTSFSDPGLTAARCLRARFISVFAASGQFSTRIYPSPVKVRVTSVRSVCARELLLESCYEYLDTVFA